MENENIGETHTCNKFEWIGKSKEWLDIGEYITGPKKTFRGQTFPLEWVEGVQLETEMEKLRKLLEKWKNHGMKNAWTQE